MGRIAGTARARGRRLTRWAFALDELPCRVADRVALVLPPAIVATLPPSPGADFGGGTRNERRRRVLAALTQRCFGAAGGAVIAGPDGVRHLAGTAFFVSIAERSGWVAAALSHAPVGIDLEATVEANVSRDSVLDGVDAVAHAASPDLAKLWAAREATLKAMGRDLTRDPGGWRFGDGTATAVGCTPHRIDLVTRAEIVAAVAYVGD